MDSKDNSVRIFVASVLFVLMAMGAMIIVPVLASPSVSSTIDIPYSPDSAGGMFNSKK